MQCIKCNSFIPEGYLYCPVCGEEVIIVSDFDINLEDNIDMTSIAASIDSNQDTKEIIPDNKFAITKDLSEIDGSKGIIQKDKVKNVQTPKKQTDVVAKEKLKKTSQQQAENKKNIIKVISIIAIIIAVLGTLGTVIGINVSRYYSYDYQYNKVKEYISLKDYENAIKTCKHLNTLGNDKKGKILLADCYMALNNYDAAIAVLYATLDDFPDDLAIYDMIIKCYEMQGDSKAISDLISNSDDTTMALRYSDYVSLPPVFSLEEGSYVEPDPIKLTAIGEGYIFYTVDGSLPTESSLSYMGPIPLEPGENTISAIFVNDKGLVSEVVTKNFYVELNIPDPPVLLVNSGTKNTPELIGVKIEEGVTVYYCEGNATPTTGSKEYKGPMLMPIGKSTYSFVAYNASGQASDVVVGDYNLTMNATIMQSVAEYAISYQLLSKGENVMANSYRTNYGFYDGNRTFYIIDEYSLDTLTGRRFAVDISTGELFSFITNPDGSYSTLPL